MNHGLVTRPTDPSRQMGRVSPANSSRPDDGRVDADIALILLDCGAEYGRVFGEVSLGERGHDAARGGTVDLQHHVAKGKRPADPLVLDEPGAPSGGWITRMGRNLRGSNRLAGVEVRSRSSVAVVTRWTVAKS